MLKKLLHREENKPIDYLAEREEKSTQKQDPPLPDDVVMTLRSDMLPGSRTLPERVNILRLINLKVLLGIFIGLVFVILVWFLAAGPARPVVENMLVSLARRDATPTSTLLPSPIPATMTLPPPTNTSRPIMTPLPSATIEIIETTSTPVQETTSPTPLSGCRDALTITLADVGQTMCIQGTIISTVENPTNFMVVFSNEPGAFYWVTYDFVWSKAEKDTCYQVTGTISQIANSPVLVFGYNNIPEVCP